MRVHIRHEFAGALREHVERLYLLDEDFNRLAFERMGIVRVVLAHFRHGDALERTVRLCPQRALPAPFSSLVPRDAFHIREQVTYDVAAHRGTWRTIPSVLAQHFTAHGTLSIDKQAGAVVFHMEGEVTCTFPLLGRRAERQAVATAELQHAQLAQIVRERLLTFPVAQVAGVEGTSAGDGRHKFTKSERP